MPINFQGENDVDLVRAYGDLLKELKTRKIINSKNLVGDLGEYLAIDCYKRTPGLVNLGPALAGGQYVDAIGMNGKTYTIKSTSGVVTGSFFGFLPPTAPQQSKGAFDFLIIVQFDADYSLKRIIELDWTQFVQYRRWLPHQNAYNVPLTQSVIAAAKTIYPTLTSVV